ncbi:ADAMTS-like protein 4 isoform X2 [Bombina bombina]|nr:ADAMTS-like protein 4 isoform X2 [Bombina bombina]
MVVCLSTGLEQFKHRTPRQALEDGTSGAKILGTWSSWGSWSVCSQTCGLGVIERSRTCLSPYQQVPWVPGAEAAPPLIQSHSQVPFHDERTNLYNFGAARPAYPLHTDSDIAAPLIVPSVPRNPSSVQYNPFNRHTRQETLPSGSQYHKRDHTSNQRLPSNRGRSRAPLPEAAQVRTPYGQDGLYAPEAISNHRKPQVDAHPTFNRKNISRQADSSPPWPFFPDSIPLLKPENWEEQNLGRVSPTKESRFSRRSRVRNSIKPGKYGYGKLPFALPLHKDKEESQRFKRHHSLQVDETLVSAWSEKGTDLKPTQATRAEDQERHHKRPQDQTSDLLTENSNKKINIGERVFHQLPHRTQTPILSHHPEKLENISMLLRLGGSQQKPLEGESSENGYYVDTTLKEVIDSDPVYYNGFGKNRKATVLQQPSLSNVFPFTSKKTVISHQTYLSTKALSTQTRDINRSEKTTDYKFPVESVTAMTERENIISVPEGHPLKEKKQEVIKMQQIKTGGTVKPMQTRPVVKRLRVLTKSSASDYQQNKNENERSRDKTIQRFIHVEQLAPSKTPLKSSEVTSSELTQDEKESSPYQLHDESDISNLPRSRRQSPNIYNTDSGRVFQSLFREPPSVHRSSHAETWPSYGANSEVSFDDGQGPRPGPHQSSDLPQWNLYNTGTEDFHCVGEQKQYKSCNMEPCPDSQPDARALQCATFNSQEFMGRLYQWEAFTEVRGNQRCELNCRPIGYRFYVRHTEKVQDGTPCEAGSFDVCVDGQCLSPGCDGILGSNSTLDICGVCGGNNSTCKFVSGTFNETSVPIGYHKILEIPKGATHINVTELTRSPNYLALRSRSGKSVINGNWAVDPPGRYEAGGTVFIYTRPGREEKGGETFTAAGPTTEALDVYMIFQQDNPGVSFQFFLSSPTASSHHNPSPSQARQEYGALRAMSSNEPQQHTVSRGYALEDRNPVPPPQIRTPPVRPAGTLQRNIRIPPIPAPPVHYWPEQPQFFWKRVGNTMCSVTCGKGFWYPIYQCVSRSSLEEVSEDECDTTNKPFPQEEACNTQPCPAFWDVGNWSVCSRTCGNGIQHRQVLCRQMYANRTTMVHPQRCGSLVKPNVTQTCQLRICSNWEIQTNWTTCSVMCGLGQRTRHVRCISNHGDIVGEVECSNRMRPRTNEVCDMGPCVRSWFHNDWSSKCSAECGTGIQRRSVICLSSSATDESQNSCMGTKPSDMRVCNSGACERTVGWYAGPWSECSADCEEGSQRRDVICVSKLGADFNVTDQSECSHLEKPPSLQTCNAGPCGARWFTTPWSACSKSCLGGVQMREVRCMASDKSISQLCDLDSKPDEKRVCNTQPCSSALDENCRDRYHNCAVVVQARLCVYTYYKQACCSSCTLSLARSRASESR